MTRPVPLMYVRNIPVVFEEESTSIFVKEDDVAHEELVINDEVLTELAKTQTPFGKHLYAPITIVTENEEQYTGSVMRLEEEVAVMKLDDTDQVKSIPFTQITNIIWRGKSLLS